MIGIWTDDAVSDLTRMWDEGLSARLIALAMGRGITRCAVIGKARRLGLSARVEGVNPNRQDSRRRGDADRFKGLQPASRRKVVREPSAKVTITKHHWQMQFVTRSPEMTKSQLRAELAQAVRNTAAMPVE